MVSQFLRIYLKTNYDVYKSETENYLLIFHSDMFEAVCLTENPVEVWCMFEKSEVNVSSFAAVIWEVDFL